MDDNTLLLRAVLRQDWDAYDSLAAEFHRQGKGTPVAIIGFTFHLAVNRYFATRRNKAEVIRFVAEARAALSEGRDIAVREAEALMFATLDLDGVPGAADVVMSLDVGIIAEIEGQLLFRLIRDLQLTDGKLDALLLEAERMATRSAH